MTHPTAERIPTATGETWLLPDDGIVDPVAVDIAAAGTRPVRLTATERELAAARILTAGGNTFTVAARLRTPYDTARRLCADLTRSGGRAAA